MLWLVSYILISLCIRRSWLSPPRILVISTHLETSEYISGTISISPHCGVSQISLISVGPRLIAIIKGAPHNLTDLVPV